MGTREPEVDSYLETIAPEHRPALDALRHLIHEIHPGIEETIEYKMPMFTHAGERVAGFASRANYISLYCNPAIVEGFRDELGKLNVGKGCIRFRRMEDLPLAVIREIFQRSAAD